MTQHPLQSYGISRWSDGYFEINEAGHIGVRPDPARAESLDLRELADEVRRAGLSLPVLLRFTDVLHHRARALCRGFDSAAEEQGYQGGYTAVYPIKVNQQRSVIEELLAGGEGRVGLEAGSKPELLAVLALAPSGGTIVCNGYKDREYIRLALIGRRLGHQVYIVIEKPSELDLMLGEAAELGVAPLLGVRVRLGVVASGNWQNSGGEKSKFGLSATQLLELVQRLRGEDKLHWLVLLHSHIGSQIPNLRDIRNGVAEAARYYSELRGLGVPLQVVDVGGGLGVDYEGTASRNYCSTNYNLDAYLREVLLALKRVCDDQGLPHPHVFTESGRAMTAHHAVILTDVIGREAKPGAGELPDLPGNVPEPLRWLHRDLSELAGRPPVETFQEAEHLFDELRGAFSQGELSLAQRALAEQLFYQLAHRVRGMLNPSSRRHRELLDRLDELLAERVFANLSIFQSLPDVWAIDQVFPVLPLQRLHEPPDVAATLHDLTCDSDGCIAQYVDADGVERTLPLHSARAGEDYLLGIFLVGAYQEILGDMHNLFGDTNAVNVELTSSGGYRLTEQERGDSVDELLRYVHFDPEQMLQRYLEKLAGQHVGEAVRDACYLELKNGLYGYTYFED